MRTRWFVLSGFGLLAFVSTTACDEKASSAPSPSASIRLSPARSSADVPSSPPSGRQLPQSSEEKQKAPEEKAKKLECPEGMVLLPGGPFWVGATHESYDREENPRFLTRLAPYCLDVTEVTTKAYEACVDAGGCSDAHQTYKTCNFRREGRGDHPINCIDFDQAKTVCEHSGKRLPTEVEWEYAARGGDKQLKYPWGDADPDGRTCWKHHQTCPVGSFEAGAFGLHDVVGNVWEWTSDWFGRYPWPAAEGRHRVYRGGSWSRRFEKWLRPTLRNRFAPDKHGSHLGVRCALTPRGAECPYGSADDGTCRRGVDDAQCLDGELWNGVRCAKKDAARCPAGSHEEAGYGCVRERVSGSANTELDTASVTRSRSPEFDSDCVANAPGRPRAYRYEGGGHLARNAVGKRDGCKNRDVGVGWNSACCP